MRQRFVIRLCGNCFFYHYGTLPISDWELVFTPSECECVECRHRSYFTVNGKVGHFAGSNARITKQDYQEANGKIGAGESGELNPSRPSFPDKNNEALEHAYTAPLCGAFFRFFKDGPLVKCVRRPGHMGKHFGRENV